MPRISFVEWSGIENIDIKNKTGTEIKIKYPIPFTLASMLGVYISITAGIAITIKAANRDITSLKVNKLVRLS